MRPAALCVLLSLAALAPARAQPVLPLDPAHRADALAGYAALRTEPGGPARRAATLDPARLPAEFWLRVRLRSAAAYPTRWVVPLSFEDVAGALVHADGRRDTLRTGTRVPLAARVSQAGRPAGVRFDLAAGETAVLWLHVRHRAGAYADVVVPRPVEAEAFLRARRRADVWNGLVLGIFVALAVYNLFLFATFRDRSYLYYVAFLLATAAYWTVTWGYATEMLWPAGRVVVPEAQFAVLVLAAIAYLLFVRRFLDAPRTAPRAGRALLGVAGLWGLAAALGLAGMWDAGQTLAALAALALLATSSATGVVALRGGFRPARAYLMAAAPFMVAGTVFSVMFVVDHALGDLALPFLQAAMVAEALGLALALVVRVRILRTERSEAVAARDAAEAAREVLRAANDLKTHLIGVVAHDLRSPLTSIAGAAELMELEAEHEPDLLELAALVRTGSARMLALVDDLLVTAALDSGTVALRRAPTDVAAMTAEVVRAYARRAAEKEQTLSLDGHAVPAVADVDAERVRAILDNLVSNAVKYTPLGGRVAVTCAAGASGLRVAFADTGPGLSPDDAAALFQRFRRLTATPTGGESSTGLGLSIASEFARLHGGRIDVETALGAGTTFTLVLPATGLAATAAPAASPAPDATAALAAT